MINIPFVTTFLLQQVQSIINTEGGTVLWSNSCGSRGTQGPLVHRFETDNERTRTDTLEQYFHKSFILLFPFTIWETLKSHLAIKKQAWLKLVQSNTFYFCMSFMITYENRF